MFAVRESPRPPPRCPPPIPVHLDLSWGSQGAEQKLCGGRGKSPGCRMGHRHSREHGMQEGDLHGKANLGSANIGKLLVDLGNLYNLLEPRLPPLLRQVMTPPPRDYGEGDARCHTWKHTERLKSLFMYCFSFQQADGTTPLMSQDTSMGSCHHGHQQPLPPALRGTWHKIEHGRFYHLPPPAQQPARQSRGRLGKPGVRSF